VWVDKLEYFLAVMEYQVYLATEPMIVIYCVAAPFGRRSLPYESAITKTNVAPDVVVQARRLTVL
jgi:hypothetical protein